jgi:hypothetical protein
MHPGRRSTASPAGFGKKNILAAHGDEWFHNRWKITREPEQGI